MRYSTIARIRRAVMTLVELAEAAGLPPRTVRFYIARGLLEGPAVAGRGADYGSEHLARLAEIRKLQSRGLTLAEVGRVLAGDRRAPAPSPWYNYMLDEDVHVWVRADAAPWRLKQLRQAIDAMSARLRKENTY